METKETIEEDDTKTTMKIPTELLDDFKHLAIDQKTTVTALIVESMKLYLKDIKKKWTRQKHKFDTVGWIEASSWVQDLDDLIALTETQTTYYLTVTRNLTRKC